MSAESTSKIKESVVNAINAINTIFKNMGFIDGVSAAQMRDIDGLINEYAKQVNLASVVEEFSSAANSVARMRSSYLPSELLLATDDLSFISTGNMAEQRLEAVNEDTYIGVESYENAFMRMIGVPMSSEVEGSEVYIMDTEQQQLVNVSATGAQFNRVLDERERNPEQRTVKISTDKFFNISVEIGGLSFDDVDINSVITVYERIEAKKVEQEMEGSTVTDEEVRKYEKDQKDTLSDTQKELFGKIFDPGAVDQDFQEIYNDIKTAYPASAKIRYVTSLIAARIQDIRIDNVHEQFFRLKSLMFPPVQNSSISECISEPKKMVARPFSSRGVRTVNGVESKPSLLETIIRIRFDKASGVGATVGGTDNSASDADIDAAGEGEAVEYDTSSAVTQDSYGILESLLILRLYSAIGAYAKNVVKNAEVIIKSLIVQKQSIGARESLNTGRRHGDTFVPQIINNDDGGRLKMLKNQRTVENAILTLFGDTSKVSGLPSSRSRTGVLDLQIGNQRNSTITNAHLVGPMLDIVGLPLRNINKEIGEIRKSRPSQGSPGGPGSSGGPVVGTQILLGLNSGIGAIDVAVFTLALFTIDEAHLLGLLSEQQFTELIEGPSGSLFAQSFGLKPDTATAVNALSEAVLDGYQMFKDGMSRFSYEDTLRAEMAASIAAKPDDEEESEQAD